MCKICETKPVYEFTNQRKLCAKCFVRYFQKKFLYTIRKFKMINIDVNSIYYKRGNSFQDVVLEDVLEFFQEKTGIEIRSLQSRSLIDKKVDKKRTALKIATSETLDLTSYKIVDSLIKKDSKNMKKFLPVEGKTIKPLYLFLDKEVLLYAKIKKLKFVKKKEKKDKINDFIDEVEKKHPEVKRAIVNGFLRLF